jgi:hypothetical protein
MPELARWPREEIARLAPQLLRQEAEAATKRERNP